MAGVAASCPDSMQLDLLSPDSFVSAVRQCNRPEDLGLAKHAHAHLCENGLESLTPVTNFLIPTFAQCGSVQAAAQAFYKCTHPNEYSWTSLLQCFMELGRFSEAFNLFHQMELHWIEPSSFTFVVMVNGCSKLQFVEAGLAIHNDINVRGLDEVSFVSNSLLDMYVKCGLLAEARQVFLAVPNHDVVSWSSLITGYAEHMLLHEVLDCLEMMEVEGISPNPFTYACSLKACGGPDEIGKGCAIHSRVIMFGFEADYVIGNTLVDMYTRCGLLVEAWKVLEELPLRDVASWTPLIAGCVGQGDSKKALELLDLMRNDGVSPNHVTYVSGLKACSIIPALEKGQQLHTEIVIQELEGYLPVSNMLVDMYLRCGLIAEAQDLFDNMQERDFVTWNVFLTGYIEHGFFEEALSYFQQMRFSGFYANAFLYASNLKACIGSKAIDEGWIVHSELIMRGFELDPIIGSTLVELYAKNVSIHEARLVFDGLPVRDAVLWTALIAGYVEHGLGQEALDCLEEMEMDGCTLDNVVIVCGLMACGIVGSTDRVRMINSKAVIYGFERDSSVVSSLIETYANCGSLDDACGMFYSLVVPNIFSWNALIAGYLRHGLGEEVLNCYAEMQSEGVLGDIITQVHCLKACSSTGALDKGRDLHAEIVKDGLEQDPLVGNILIDMYAKCGIMDEAHVVFAKLSNRDVFSWTTLITGYSECGQGEVALSLYIDMRSEGVAPDTVTFICCLKACGTMGALLEGQKIHDEIVRDGCDKDYAIWNNLMDMYSKCSSVADAQDLVNNLPRQAESLYNHQAPVHI